MAADHQVRALVRQPAGSPPPPILGGVDFFLPAVVKHDLEIGILLRLMNAADDLPRLPLVPQAVADHGDAEAVFLIVKGLSVISVQQTGLFHRPDGIPGPLGAVVAGVVVGQGHRLHAGGGQNLRIGRAGTVPVGGVVVLHLLCQLPVRQHVFQVHHREIIGLEQVPHVLQKVGRLIPVGVGVEVAGGCLILQGCQHHVAGEADHDIKAHVLLRLALLLRRTALRLLLGLDIQPARGFVVGPLLLLLWTGGGRILRRLLLRLDVQPARGLVVIPRGIPLVSRPDTGQQQAGQQQRKHSFHTANPLSLRGPVPILDSRIEMQESTP